MSPPPPRPKIYHITHYENLERILADGELVSDRQMVERGGPARAIGLSEIKRRRIEELPVSCHPETNVGDYVPFYFCPRSVMLYVIYRANHLELEYRGGQAPIIHLEADLNSVVRWAEANQVRWAFALSNAGARYTEFRATLDDLDDLDWEAIRATDFRRPEIKEGKQAEFLLFESFPFSLVERIGVYSEAIHAQVEAAIANSGHRPVVEVRRDWYF